MMPKDQKYMLCPVCRIRYNINEFMELTTTLHYPAYGSITKEICPCGSDYFIDLRDVDAQEVKVIVSEAPALEFAEELRHKLKLISKQGTGEGRIAQRYDRLLHKVRKHHISETSQAN